MDCSLPGFPVLHHLLVFAQIHVHWVSDATQPSHLLPPPLLLASDFPSIRIFSNESALHSRWPKYWSFSLSLSPYNEYSGLISFRMDWLDLLAVQGTLKSLLPTTVWKHQFFGAQPSLWTSSPWWLRTVTSLCMMTGKAGIIHVSTCVVTVGSTILQLYQVGSPRERQTALPERGRIAGLPSIAEMFPPWQGLYLFILQKTKVSISFRIRIC